MAGIPAKAAAKIGGTSVLPFAVEGRVLTRYSTSVPSAMRVKTAQNNRRVTGDEFESCYEI